MKKSRKTTLKRNGIVFTLINPVYDIPIEQLVQKYGSKTIKVNHLGGPIFEIEGWQGSEEELGEIADFSNLQWEDIDI
jgi:hypothetical protein